jgi:lipoprotein-releasing system permease protein
LSFETFIFKRYFNHPYSERSSSVVTILSIIGVAVGVTALIISLSVMNGFEKDLKESLQGINGHITVYTFTPGGFEWDTKKNIATKIKQEIPVKAIAPFTEHQALIMGGSKPQGTFVKGIDVDKEVEVSPLGFMIRTQSFEVLRDKSEYHDKNNKQLLDKAKKILAQLRPHTEIQIDEHGNSRKVTVTGIIIGTQMARKMAVRINDWVKIMSPEERITPMGNMPRAKRFKVVGFFESGLMGYDEIFSMIDIGIAQKLYRMGDNISGLTIKLEDSSKADEYKGILQEKISLPYIFSSWQDQNRNLFAVIQLEKIGLAVILYCIIIIAGVSIISSLIILVIEKNKDIAILKAMGATNRSIHQIFIYLGTTIGIAGTFIGMILGLVACYVIGKFDIIDIPPGVYAGNRIPMHVETWQVLMIAAVSVLICFIVTIFPSRKAAKLDPVIGLKNE